MKKIIFLALICLAMMTSKATDYYMAPTTALIAGNDANVGSQAAPWATTEHALNPGDHLYMMDGVFRSIKTSGNDKHFKIDSWVGTSTDTIYLVPFPGARPVFDLSNFSPTTNDPTAFWIENCSYIKFKGARITGLKQRSNGAGVSRGMDLHTVTNSLIEFIELDNIGGYGFILSNGTHDVTFLNCDAHHMDDRYTTGGGAWGNANGFQCTGGSTATNCTFDGCRAWWISDDGFDLYGVNGTFTFRNCWAFWNGYEPGTFVERGDGDGFKLGPTADASKHSIVTRTLSYCLAFENKRSGFDQNNGDTKYRVYNCGSIGNKSYGYMYDYITPAPVQDFRNNYSYNDIPTSTRGDETNGSKNSWNISGMVIQPSDFQSLSSAGMDGPRQADGSLPKVSYAKLSIGSKLRNAGLPISGFTTAATPDLGPFPYQTGGPIITTKRVLAAVLNDKQVDLTIQWEPAPEKGSVYLINRNGNQIGGTTSAFYSDWAPEIGTNNYQVLLNGETTNTATVIYQPPRLVILSAKLSGSTLSVVVSSPEQQMANFSVFNTSGVQTQKFTTTIRAGRSLITKRMNSTRRLAYVQITAGNQTVKAPITS